MNFARTEGDVLSLARENDEVATVVDSLCLTGERFTGPRPGDRLSLERIALPVVREQTVQALLVRLEPDCESFQQAIQNDVAVNRSAGLDPKRRRGLEKLGAELFIAGIHVQPDADHRPSLRGPGLDQDARDLPASHEDVIGPLDQAFHRRDVLEGLADRKCRREREKGGRLLPAGIAQTIDE